MYLTLIHLFPCLQLELEGDVGAACGAGSSCAPPAGASSNNSGPSGANNCKAQNRAGPSGSSKALFLEKVHQSTAACQSGDFDTAVALYTEAIALDPQNHILYSNRSAAHIKLQQYQKALQDAIKARDLNPKWPKVSRNYIVYLLINCILLPFRTFFLITLAITKYFPITIWYNGHRYKQIRLYTGDRVNLRLRYNKLSKGGVASCHFYCIRYFIRKKNYIAVALVSVN